MDMLMNMNCGTIFFQTNPEGSGFSSQPNSLRVNNDDERPVLCHGSQWVGDIWGLAAKVLNVWEFWVSSGPEMAAIHPRSVRYPHSLLYPPNEHSHGPMENICPEPNKCYFP